MKLLVVRMWALLLAVVFVATAAAASVSKNSTASEQTAEPKATGPTPRVVLIEMFTGTWCTWCGVIKPGISRLLDEYGPDKLLMLAYHNGDVFTDASLDTSRRAFYQQPFGGFPTTVIDGGGYTTGTSLFVVGSQGDSPSDYNFYKTKTEGELNPSKYTNMEITLSGDLKPTTASIRADVHATFDVTELTLKMRFALYEDTLYETQVNGPPVHKYVVRQLVEQPFSIANGQTLTFTHDFTPNPSWDMNRMGIVGFVQDDARRSYTCYGTRTCYNSPVIQAARYHFVTPNTLYVRDDDVTDMDTAPLRGEYMEAALSSASRPFEVWNRLDTMDTGTNDIRGTPMYLDMEEFGALVWSAGSASGILNPTNINDLSTYLNGPGNLYIHGETVPSDIEATASPFLTGYLHGTHGADPGPPAPTYMNGVAGDPITGAWSATNLAFAGAAPETIDPAGPGSVTILNYPGMFSAGIRADHDANSRVVTAAQNYFQGSDPIARRTLMIDNVLNWLDGSSAPRVSLITPNGGEQYTAGQQVAVKWKAIDVEIPKNGVDVYYTDTLSAPVWTPLATSEPNDGVYSWTVPSVQTADCGIRIVVRDGDPATPDGEAISAGPCVIGTPDVSMTKQVSNPTPLVGEQITYTITLINAGPVTGYATATDALPIGVTYVSDDGALTGVSAYFPGNRTCVWTGAVPGLSSVIWNIVVTVDAGPPGTTVNNYAFFNSTNSAGGSAQSGNDNAAFQIPSTETWYINLAIGKRFMSIPLLLTDYSVNAVLASIAGQYSYVRQYDARDAANPWKSYVPGRAYNTLTHLNFGTGFWIEITSPANLSVTGARPITSNIDLVAGWNMVGYPSYSTTYTIGAMKAAMGLPNVRAEGFDASAPGYNLWRLPDSYIMKAGEGYWIYVPSDCVWTVTF